MVFVLRAYRDHDADPHYKIERQRQFLEESRHSPQLARKRSSRSG
jgi:hypothetical protein